MIQSELYLHSTRDIACKDIILFRTKNTNETIVNTGRGGLTRYEPSANLEEPMIKIIRSDDRISTIRPVYLPK